MRFLSALLLLGLTSAPAPVPEQTPAVAGTTASAPTYETRTDFNLRVKMRDGVELSADVTRPAAEGRFPVILARTPYNKASGGKDRVELVRYFASRGYVFVAMDVRGRGDSDGEWVPYRHDGADGYDAIEWCAAQPWSTGKVGTIGGSYNGKTQWLTAVLRPPHLAAMIAMTSPSDPFVEFPTGVPIPSDISWYHYTAGHVVQNEEAVDWLSVYDHLPLVTMDEAAGRPNAVWKDQFEHARLDSWWDAERYQNKLDQVQVPVLHISGWYDDEQIGTPLNYIGVSTRGAPEARKAQRLLMGPWPHALNSGTKLGEVEFGPTAKIDINAVWLRFFDRWLKGVDDGLDREPPVRIFVMGENVWRDEAEWPLARTRYTKYYLHGGRANSLLGDGSLSTTEPSAEKPDTYTHDPARAVPFITDPSFAQLGGPDDYRSVERRDDVLVYSTGPLSQDTEVCGPIKARLWASTSGKDADFMAKLLDVWPDGFAQRLSDGMVRARFREGMDRPAPVEPGRAYPLDVDVWNTCQLFRAGHRIRLEIASSAFPKFDRNPSTGEPLGKTARLERSEQKILHDREHPSHLVLPIVPRKP
jgi:putative CocE/NonD family hydrolase